MSSSRHTVGMEKWPKLKKARHSKPSTSSPFHQEFVNDPKLLLKKLIRRLVRGIIVTINENFLQELYHEYDELKLSIQSNHFSANQARNLKICMVSFCDPMAQKNFTNLSCVFIRVVKLTTNWSRLSTANWSNNHSSSWSPFSSHFSSAELTRKLAKFERERIVNKDWKNTP